MKGQFLTLAASVLLMALVASALLLATVNPIPPYSTQSQESVQFIYENVREESLHLLETLLANITQMRARGYDDMTISSIVNSTTANWTRSLRETYLPTGIAVNVSIRITTWQTSWNTNPGTSAIYAEINITVSDGTTTIRDHMDASIVYTLTVTTDWPWAYAKLTRTENNYTEGVDFAEVYFNGRESEYIGGGTYRSLQPVPARTINCTAITSTGVIVQTLYRA